MMLWKDIITQLYNYFQACIDKVDLIEDPLIRDHITKSPNYAKYHCAQHWV